MAHGIPYVATATVADLHDLEDKVTRAMEIHGARYIHILVTCPLGWGSAPSDTVKVARLATQTGLFPVFEAEHGEVVRASTIRRPCPGRGVPAPAGPLRAPLRRGREPGPARHHRRTCRRWPTATSLATACSRVRRCRPHDGEALRHHPRGRIEPGQQDRLVAGRAAGVRRPSPPVQRRLPGRARTSSSGSTWPRTAPTRRPGARSCATTRCPP